MSEGKRKPRGRPRSKASRDKALAVARQILHEEGFGRLTIDAVAARSGVGKPTIYRTWANAQELAMAALIAQAPGPDALWPTDPVDALRRQLEQLIEVFATTRGRQTAQVLASADPDSELSKAFRNRVILASRDEGRGLLEAAVKDGVIAVPPDWDVLLDMVYGPLFYRLLVGHGPLTAALAGGIVDTVLAALPARAAPPQPALRGRQPLRMRDALVISDVARQAAPGSRSRPMPSRTAQTFTAPVVEAFRWLDEIARPEGLALINVSQAAPALPPPEPLRAHMAQLVMDDPAVHLYGPDLGLPALRTEIAARVSHDYGGRVAPENVAVTAGCNQAFCAAIAAITDQGDEVILPTPWYFNHKMWLDMAGVKTVPLPSGDSLVPDPAEAAARLTDRTRAIVLVTPNNPGGVEYPADTVAAFRDLARARGLHLILDETYRDFDARTGAPHELFADENWADTVIQLYSFSKAYRLTGHRTGCLVAHQALLPEVEKFMDTVAICAPQLGQHAALWGMQNLDQWLAGERDEILARRAALETAFANLEPLGWRLKGLGAYFAYVEHPFAMASDALCRAMLAEAAILALPATFFMPEGDPEADRHLRIAFANVGADTLKELCTRLAALGFERRAD